MTSHLSEDVGSYNDDNKAIPRIREYELNENSTRYDQIAAAPSDEMLVYYWYTWAALAFLVGLFSFLLFLSGIMNPKVRRKPFNLYLMYLLIPDFVFSMACGITCFINAISGHYYSKLMCNVQQWYCVFGIGGSAWINAIIAYQVHTMLKDSHARRRYRVPTITTVTYQCLAAFSWVFFLGSWGVLEESNFPFHSGLISGMACLPTEVDQASSIFFWAVFAPFFVGIPTTYAIWVSFDIHRRKLLPPNGKRRMLSIYFARLLLVFCIMWIPAILLIFAVPSFTPTWVSFLGGTWSHLQTLFSAGIICMIPEMRQAFTNFLCCRRLKTTLGDDEDSDPNDGLAGHLRSDQSFFQLRSSTNHSTSLRFENHAKERSNEEEHCGALSSLELQDISKDLSMCTVDEGVKEQLKPGIKNDEVGSLEVLANTITEATEDDGACYDV